MTTVPRPVRSPRDRYLLPTERRIFAVRRHWVILARPVGEAVAALVIATVLGVVAPEGGVLIQAAWLGVLLVATRTSWLVAEWWFDRLMVTNARILLITGLLTRKVAMMPLAKVTDMTYKRSPVGRMLGYGDFVMESAGQDQALHTIKHLPRPDELYLRMCEVLFGVPPEEPQPPETVLTETAESPPPPDRDTAQAPPAVVPEQTPEQTADDIPTDPGRAWWVVDDRGDD